MAYRNSLQANALKLVAKKLQSFLAVKGELPEDRLAANGDDGEDLMLALARQVVSGEVDDGRKVVEQGAEEHQCRRDNILESRLLGEDPLGPIAW